jgi:uncharacterized OB-fold protein
MAPMTTEVPAIEGWFTTSPPALTGTRCVTCGSYFFPPERTLCRNPGCMSTSLDEVALSRNGKIWSWSVNHYAAPAPYVGKEPFEPYTVVAVELADEAMVVLGQLADGVDPSTLSVGADAEIVIETLFTDDDGIEQLVWKWRPTS